MKQAKISQDKLYIIAELGINHNGDLNIAKKLIKNAIQKRTSICEI